MAEYRTQKTGPGIVIFVALMCLVALSIVVGKFSFLRDERDITIYLDSVSGVKERTAVVYAGRKCGEISDIRILQPADSKTKVVPKGESTTLMVTNHYYVIVRARIEASTPVNQDTKASVMMVGMLGDKQLDLAPGDPGAPPLGPNDALYGENAGMERLVTTGRKLIAKVESMMENLQTLMSHLNNVLKDPQFQDNLKGVVANARTTLEKAGATLAEAKEMLGENRPNIKGTLANARELTDKGKTTLGTLNETLTETKPKLAATMDNVQKLTGEVRPKVTALMDKTHDTMGKAGGTLDNVNGLLADNRPNITMLLTNLRDMGYNTKQFTHTMRMIFAPWTAFSKQKEPEKPQKGAKTDKKDKPAGEVKVLPESSAKPFPSTIPAPTEPPPATPPAPTSSDGGPRILMTPDAAAPAPAAPPAK